MSLLEKYFHDADAAKPQSEAGRSDHPMSEGSRYSESSVNLSPNKMSTSSFIDQVFVDHNRSPRLRLLEGREGKPHRPYPLHKVATLSYKPRYKKLLENAP